MKRPILVGLVSLIAASLGAGSLCAQQRSTSAPSLRRSTRPTTSPYLNLLGRGSANIGSEYYRRVRPEMEFRREYQQTRNSLDRIQRQVNQQQLELQQSRASQLTSTGHTTRFLDLGSYYSSPRAGR